MKVQNKLLLLCVTALVAFNLLLLWIGRAEQDILQSLYRHETAEKQIFFNSIIELKTQPTRLFLLEYTYWDELVSFAETGQKEWADTYLVPLLGQTYNFDAIWVYKTDASLTYSFGHFNTPDIQKLPIPKEAFDVLFLKDRQCLFYFNTPAGLMEVHGATIHPSSDSAKKTTPHGYFFVGILWDKEYLQELSQIVGGQVTLSSLFEQKKDILVVAQPETGMISVAQSLFSWEGKPLYFARALRQSEGIVEYTRHSRQSFFGLRCFAWSLFFILVSALLYWVFLPLRRISETLSTENMKPVEKLKNQKSEFGRISTLIEQSFKQKQDLIKGFEERKNVEKALQDQFEFLQNLMDTIPTPIFYKNREGRYLGCNTALEHFLGISRKDFIGKTVYDIFPPEMAARHQAKDVELFKSGGIQAYEDELSSVDGVKYQVVFNKAPYVDTFRNVVGLVGAVQDISGVKRAEAQLRLQSTALESAANSIVITDNLGNIIWVNSSFGKLTGYTFEEIIGQHTRILKSGAQEPDFYKRIWETIITGNVWHGEIINRRKDGSLYTEEMTITPVRNEESQITHFVAIKQDIGARKKAEEQLKSTLFALEKKNEELQDTQAQLLQSEKMAAVGQLSAGVAHEIKNPLAIIMLAIEQLESRVGQDENNKRYLQMIKNAVVRSDKVIIELLNFSRFSRIESETVTLSKVIDGAISLVENSARLQGINISREYSPLIDTLEADSILLEQVFVNLLTNAIDAIVKDGVITIKTYPAPLEKRQTEKVTIEFADNGCGIPEDILPRIFEPFFTTKDQGKGTGLGLSTVYMILEKHHGTVRVESKENAGTKFILTLPRKFPEEGKRNAG